MIEARPAHGLEFIVRSDSEISNHQRYKPGLKTLPTRNLTRKTSKSDTSNRFERIDAPRTHQDVLEAWAGLGWTTSNTLRVQTRLSFAFASRWRRLTSYIGDSYFGSVLIAPSACSAECLLAPEKRTSGGFSCKILRFGFRRIRRLASLSISAYTHISSRPLLGESLHQRPAISPHSIEGFDLAKLKYDNGGEGPSDSVRSTAYPFPVPVEAAALFPVTSAVMSRH